MSHAARHSERSATSKITLLKDRAAMLAAARAFFLSRNVMEVDVPLCTSHACIDENIDLMTVVDGQGSKRYLQSSPEYGMKRLLSEGSGDIYQIGHVFRDGEVGSRHNPEFSMVEWYRCGFTLEQLVAETALFIELFLGQQPCSILTYRAAMHTYAGIDYVNADEEQLLQCIRKHGIELSAELAAGNKDDLLNILIGSVVEPHLGRRQLTAITDFPATQCALAEIEISEGAPVAKRFEFYYEGNELANGYRELRDPQEQKMRLERSNQARLKKGKEALPVDPLFLDSLRKGFPACCGVAVGFDRLMMLRHSAAHIKDIIPYCWTES
ncbi:MAG: EF-P lysine aminoacylase EpmA [Parachlamydiales bacterium]|jgi:lysyl-tRNA synthetase class 2